MKAIVENNNRIKATIMNKSLVSLLILVLSLISCSPHVLPNNPAVLTKEVPTQKSEPTSIVMPVPSVTDDASVLDLQKNCIPILSAPDNRIIDGNIVFLDNLGQSLLLVGKNELRIPEEFKGNNGNSEQSVSPDGTLLMFREVTYEPTQSHIVLVTSDGQVARDFPDDQRWVSGITWLSSEYIRYPMTSQTDKEQLRLYALNAETGKMRELRTNLPDIADNGSPNWGIDAWAMYFGIKKGVNIVYDSSLTRVAYPKIQAIYPFYPVVLYNVQNNKELAIADLESSADPKWSPDGRYFSIVGSELVTPAQDIYIVKRDGNQFTPLTNLAKLYPKVKIESYGWSPDSSQIAFWARLEDSPAGDNNSFLFLFDIVTMKITDLCIKGFGNNPPLGVKTSLNLRGQPIWSPDGKKLLITQYDANNQEVVVIWIDLENQIAYPIATDLEPIGWMN